MRNKEGNYNYEIKGKQYLYQPHTQTVYVDVPMPGDNDAISLVTVAIFGRQGDEITSRVNINNPDYIEMYQQAVRLFTGVEPENNNE